jgi:hypothetical protein
VSAQNGDHRRRLRARADLEVETVKGVEDGGLCAGEVGSDLGMGVQGAAQPLQLRQQAVGLGDEGVHERSPSVRWFREG